MPVESIEMECMKSKTNLAKETKKKWAPEEQEAKNIANRTSDVGAFLHVIKGSLGCGLLATPFAFKHAGWFVGVVGCALIGAVVSHTAAILVECAQFLCEITGKATLTYAETAEMAFLHGRDGRYEKFAKKAKYAVNVSLFVTYYGISVVYVILIAATFKQVLAHYVADISIRTATLLLIVVVYPVGIVRAIKHLVPFSGIANVCLMAAVGLIFSQIFGNLPDLSSRTAVASPRQWPLFLSTVLLGMEGIGTILPVQNEMRNPRHLTEKPGILYLAMCVIVFFSTSLGFFGYLKYGNAVEGTISLNLPGDWLSEAVKITIALVILFTYGFNMTVPASIAWEFLSPYAAEFDETRAYYAVRSGVVVTTVIFAAVFPKLGPVISFCGSIGFSILGIFCPAAIEYACLDDRKLGRGKWKWWKNVILMVFAVCAAVVGGFYSFLDIIR